MTTAPESPVEINGWRVYAHPLFLDQLEALITEVDQLRRKDPLGYDSKNASKHPPEPPDSQPTGPSRLVGPAAA